MSGKTLRLRAGTRGSLLALWRVLRCQPLCDGGNDPVPDTFHLPSCRCPGASPHGH